MDLSKIRILSSTTNDINLITRVNDSAFETTAESNLVINLLKDKSANPTISLIAYLGNTAVGHILFSKVRFEGTEKSPLMHILAPMSVIPDYQGYGIGKILMHRGFEYLKRINSEIVFVLGHINYYPQSGFIKDAEKYGFRPPYKIPTKVKDAWMVKEVNKGAMKKYDGKIICADELNKKFYWEE